jgi:hypothetical protein
MADEAARPTQKNHRKAKNKTVLTSPALLIEGLGGRGRRSHYKCCDRKFVVSNAEEM